MEDHCRRGFHRLGGDGIEYLFGLINRVRGRHPSSLSLSPADHRSDLTFIARTLLLAFVVVLAVGPTYSQQPAAQPAEPAIAEGILDHQVLFDTSTRADVACYRIPSLVTAPNGDLLAAVDERVTSCDDLRGNRDVNIVMRRSSDAGATWSALESIVNFPDGRSASDPSIIIDEISGDVLLFYNYMDHDGAAGTYRLHVMRSRDQGRTWSDPLDITPQITRPEWRDDFVFITSGRGTQTRSGMLLHVLVHLGEGAFVFGSRDHGETWFRLDAPLRPADESKIVELSDGRWMVNSRVNDAGVRYVHVSSDEGRTWTSRPDSSLIDPGANAGFIRYDDAPGDPPDSVTASARSSLLFSNAASSTRRENLTVRTSRNDGASWNAGRSIYPGPSAYSTMTVLDDGTIGLLFEKDDSVHAGVAGWW